MTRRTVTLVAAGALGLGGLAAAVPALAGAGPGPQPGPTATAGPGGGWRGGIMGDGFGPGGMMGNSASPGGMMGNGAGNCAGLGLTAAKGALTEAQKSALATAAEQEKLAQDLYTAFAGRYDAVIFDHIAAGESRHLSAVRTLLQRYGVADPTAGKAAGRFSDSDVQARYDKLLAQGRAGLTAALGVGQQVERDAVADLTAAVGGLTAPDVQQLYTHLVAASQRHLAMFE